jgi:hypothetical protein
MKSKVILSLLLAFISFNSYTQTFNTTNQNLVVKEASCKSPPLAKLFGTIVNRGVNPSEGLINLKIYDNDNDIVYQSNGTYKVGSETGSTFVLQIDIGDCVKPYRYLITLKECKLKPFSFRNQECE